MISDGVLPLALHFCLYKTEGRRRGDKTARVDGVSSVIQSALTNVQIPGLRFVLGKPLVA